MIYYPTNNFRPYAKQKPKPPTPTEFLTLCIILGLLSIVAVKLGQN